MNKYSVIITYKNITKIVANAVDAKTAWAEFCDWSIIAYNKGLNITLMCDEGYTTLCFIPEYAKVVFDND